MTLTVPSIPARVPSNSKISPKTVGFLALAVVSLATFASPASAQTTTSTQPATILDSMTTGIGKMDDIAGVGAALGMASTIFGGTALVLKRFLYS